MGVPKFYKWLSERYPLINQVANSDIKPEFDNLYLDMNGIIHNSTHSDLPEDTSKSRSMDQMLTAIFAYLEKLFRIAQPQKLLYMAIDGVAPRAKMNQQRQRRFRSAKDAREAMEAMRARGEEVDPHALFDSNCITPGTQFMNELSDHIRYFIRKKIKEDVAWQKIKVIFSGAEVPGEGEHKIMLYLRNMKSQPGYEPNQRHLLYGLDADLVMLSLASHEPNFALLREEVVFGSSKLPRKILKKQDEFQFLHISLLREYLDLEFGGAVRDVLPFEYSLERIIDDWVILAFLVGNDFLPHLPTLDIGEGGLDTLFAIYKEELPKLGGYIFDQREITWNRLEVILRRMGSLEEQIFSDRQQQAIDFAKKQKRKERRAQPVIEIAEDELWEGEEASPSPNPDELWESLAELEEKKDESILEVAAGKYKVFDSQLAMLMRSADAPAHLDDEGHALDYESLSFKERYYREKFPEFYDKGRANTMQASGTPLKSTSAANIRDLVQNYTQGLKWVASYYYEGCRSWKWFFAYRYAPLASDLVDLASLDLSFQLGYPFRPMEQLLGVLPPASGKFLPPAYRALMDPRTSPIADFYPLDFSIDMNGKRSAWEGIALIPFIDESRLLNALAHISQAHLSPAEQNRNARYGQEYLLQYDPSNTETYPASYPTFPSIVECHSKETVWQVPGIPLTPEEQADREKYEAETLERAKTDPSILPVPSSYAGNFQPRLCEGVKIPIDGYPSLVESVRVNGGNLTATLQKVAVNVFGMESKKDSLVLKVDKDAGSASGAGARLAKQFVQKRVFIDWPYLKEGLVTRLTDATHVYTTATQGRPMNAGEIGSFRADCVMTQAKLMSTRAVDVGPIHVLLHVQPFIGMQRSPSGGVARAFAEEEILVPLQLIFPSHPNPDPRYAELPPPKLSDAFPLGCEIVYTGPQHYGARGTIISHDSARSVSIRLQVEPPETTFGRTIAQQSRLQYYPSYLVSKTLNIHPLVLSKICSSVFVQQERTDIGLKIKFAKQSMQVPEYARRVEAWNGAGTAAGQQDRHNNNASPPQQGNNEGWEYSEKAVALLAAYKRRFPLLFEMMNEEPSTFKYDGSRLIQPTPIEAAKSASASPPALSPSPDLTTVVPTKTASDAILEIDTWLKTVGINNLPLIPCSSLLMAERGIKAIEQESARLAALRAQQPKKEVLLKNVPIFHLYRPDPVVAWSPTEAELPELGDRILSLRSDRGVPFGLRGTVVCVHPSSKTVEVVFDTEFMTGTHLHHKCSNLRGQTLPLTATLNLTKPKVLAPKNQVAGAETVRQQQQPQQPQQQQRGHNKQQPQQQQQRVSPPAAQAPAQPNHNNSVPQILKRPTPVAAAAAPAPVAAAAPVAASAANVVDVESASNALKQMLQIGGNGNSAQSAAPLAAAVAAAAPSAAASSASAPSEEEETDPMQRMLNKGKARKSKATATGGAAAAGVQPGLVVGPPVGAYPPHLPYMHPPPPHMAGAYPPHFYPPPPPHMAGPYPPMHMQPPPQQQQQGPYPPMNMQPPPQQQPHPQPPQQQQQRHK